MFFIAILVTFNLSLCELPRKKNKKDALLGNMPQNSLFLHKQNCTTKRRKGQQTCSRLAKFLSRRIAANRLLAQAKCLPLATQKSSAAFVCRKILQLKSQPKVNYRACLQTSRFDYLYERMRETALFMLGLPILRKAMRLIAPTFCLCAANRASGERYTPKSLTMALL